MRRQLRNTARTIPGKAQLFINSFARALEVIPRQLCDNAGFDATDVLNKLRQKHAQGDGSGQHFGVDVNTGAPCLLATLGVCLCSGACRLSTGPSTRILLAGCKLPLRGLRGSGLWCCCC